MNKKHFHELFPKVRRINKNVSSDINTPPTYPILDFDGQPTPFIDAAILFPNLEKKIAGYTEIVDDLNRGAQSLKRIHFLGTEDDVILEALFANAINHYGRCFTQADRRRITLDNQWIKKGTKEETAHEQIMHMRHQLFAHAGNTPFKDTKVFLLVDNEQKPTRLKGISNLGRTLTTTDLGTTLRYVAHFEQLAARVKLKLDEFCNQLVEEAKNKLNVDV